MIQCIVQPAEGNWELAAQSTDVCLMDMYKNVRVIHTILWQFV